MKASNILCGIVFAAALTLMVGCNSADPMKEIRTLEAEGKIVDAKAKFQELVETEKNPNLDREYIKFLFKHNLYADFRTTVREHLGAHPDDKEIKDLEFEYYAAVVTSAEQAGNYADAMEYLTRKLLSPDYKDYRKWEARQTTIMRKWFEKAKEDKDAAEQKAVMNKMIGLGYEPLAKSLDPVLFEQLQSQSSE